MTSPRDEEEAGPLQPISVGPRREPALDVLRGFALLGILVINIEDFATPRSILHNIPLDVVLSSGSCPALDRLVMTLQWLLFEGKMRALFTILFGAGSMVLLRRIERHAGTGPAADIFHRRSMWLLLFGILHGSLIWWQDMLFFYATLALLALYPLRRVAARRLVASGLLIGLAGSTLGLGTAMHAWEAVPKAALEDGARAGIANGRRPTSRQMQALNAAEADHRRQRAALRTTTQAGGTPYEQFRAANAATHAEFITEFFASGWFAETLGLLIAGMGLWKSGFLSARWSSRSYGATALSGYLIALTVTMVGLDHARRAGFSEPVTVVWMFPPYGIAQIAGMFGHAALIMLLVRRSAFLLLQHALASVGRMALTNYIFTSLLCQYLFRWGSWELYGKLEFYQQMYVVAAIWVLNIAGSMVWLRIFAFGPMEWIWRSLTYWKRQPVRALQSA